MTSVHGVERVRRAYVGTGLLFFNCVLLFVGINFAVAGARAVWHRVRHTDLGQEARTRGLDHVAKAYRGWKRDDLVAFLRESERENVWIYEAFTVFRPAPLRGRYVNVNRAGYREGASPAPWPPSPGAFNVFLLGGSTAFGIGQPDSATIAAQLQRSLGSVCGKAVVVYNFGRPAYYSIQEGILFQRLLRAGARPDLAIFLDGLNDFGYDEPAMTPALTQMVAEANSQRIYPRVRELIASLPVAALARRRVGQQAGELSFSAGLTPRQVIDRWLQNRRMLQSIARQAGSGILFVWQPIPNFHYDIRFHLFADRDSFAGWGTQEGYAILDRLRVTQPLGGDFLWLADLQSDEHQNLYVDRFHYDERFSGVIASTIAKNIRDRTRCPNP